jgi:serine/threonine-protein kinase
MSPQRICPDCGSPLPADAPRGLCPQCLMGAALSANGSAATAHYQPATAGVLETIAQTIGPVPRVLLRDTAPGEAPGPIVRPDGNGSDSSIRYRIDGEIARGGMGAVLKGRDPDLGREVALKVLREEFVQNAGMVRRFVEEAQIGGQPQHPGVVPIYELGTMSDRRPFFSMKLVKGHTFAQLLAHRPGASAELARHLSIFQAVCQTVAYAHARGVIHRDLKPSNVMVGSFGEVQVMDWGLAKVLPGGGVVDDSSAGKSHAETIIATGRSGDHDSDLSHAGSIMGTPAYMAPEQARGEVDQVDERADVFALGSMLCEILTGQPALVGRSSGEIQRKAALGDLADCVARLDGSGADAELIALTKACLAREREDRPRDASLVMDRLGGYLASIEERLRAAELERAAEAARAEEARARVAVERSRWRRTVALAASLLALAVVGGGASNYFLYQRQSRLAAADQVLAQATVLLSLAHDLPGEPGRWQVALATAMRLEGADLTPDARARYDALNREALSGARAAHTDKALLARLVDIRSIEPSESAAAFNDKAYADAFRAAGFDIDQLGPESAGAQIRARPAPVPLALAAALDEWANERRLAKPDDVSAWQRLIATAREADHDARRGELRSLMAERDLAAQRASLRSMAEKADVATWPAPTLNLLAATVAKAGEVDAAIALLRRAVGRYPDDLWLNYSLARLLERANPPRRDEAIRYYSVARALRPETAHELGHALEARHETDEAIAIFRDLVRLRPNDGRHALCLGRVLQSRGPTDEARKVIESAVTALRQAIQFRPDNAGPHANLGFALAAQGRQEEAVAEFREAVRLQPDNVAAHIGLGIALMERGELDVAIASDREAIRLEPENALAHYNLGIALARRRNLEDSAGEYREAIRLRPDYAEAHCNLGFVLRQQGKYADALLELRTGHSLGSRGSGWPYPSADWVRQTEQFVALADRLPAFLSGQEQPKNNAERLAFGRMCFDRSSYAAAARFWAEAFADDPALSDDRVAQHRYSAACAAALAGYGKTKDDPAPDEAARTQLRGQARAWLEAELIAWTKLLESADSKQRGAIAATLAHWQTDPDLEGVRDPKAIDALPEPERDNWRTLWKNVGATLARAQERNP